MTIRAVLLVLPLLLSHCDDYVDVEYGSVYDTGIFSVTPTLSIDIKDACELHFFSPAFPEKRTVFHVRGQVMSANSLYPHKILSPDKKWILLKTGDADGFVFCKTENILECVKQDCFEGKFNLEFGYESGETEQHPLVNFIKWEEPATVVFYDEATDKDRLPHRKTEVYKINLETGIFTLPEQPNPSAKPVLIRERELKNSKSRTEQKNNGNRPD